MFDRLIFYGQYFTASVQTVTHSLSHSCPRATENKMVKKKDDMWYNCAFTTKLHATGYFKT